MDTSRILNPEPGAPEVTSESRSQSLPPSRITSCSLCSLPPELLYIILSYCFDLDTPKEVYRSMRLTCHLLRDMVSSQYFATRYSLGNLARLNVFKEESVALFDGMKKSTLLPAVRRLSVRAESNPEMIELQRARLKPLENIDLFVNMKGLSIRLPDIQSVSCDAFNAPGITVLRQNLLASQLIFSSFVAPARDLSCLRSLSLNNLTPAVHEACETEEWHTLLSKLSTFVLWMKKNPRTVISREEIEPFTKHLREHWLSRLSNVRKLSVYFFGNMENDYELAGVFCNLTVLSPSTEPIDRSGRFTKLRVFTIGGIHYRARAGLVPFLSEYRDVIKKATIKTRLKGGIPRFSWPLWMYEAWPFVNIHRKDGNYVFSKEQIANT